MIKIYKQDKLLTDESVVYIINKNTNINNLRFSKIEIEYIKKKIKDDDKIISVNHFFKWSYLVVSEQKKEHYKINESTRKSAAKLFLSVKKHKHSKIFVKNCTNNKDVSIAFAEGLALSSYQFIKYFKDKKKKENKLKEIKIVCPYTTSQQVEQLQIIIEAVFYSRDMVNEPVSFLNATQLTTEIIKIGEKAGFSTDIFNKKKIEALKMGGLLSVNKGSIDPPTFSVLEWKPEKYINKKPIIFVGKGVVFDTGGLSLKPTKDSMDAMKSDMAGASAVIGAMYAISKAKLPVHIIGLIPATDNRPDGNAYAPGDVINMYDGSTVEVLNTDAEGRMILADALSYAKQYKPELVIDLATLTGAAHAAIGHFGIVEMGNAKQKIVDKLKSSGNNVYERIVEFPFWEEYEELIKSEIADLKNIGGRTGGAITAGKFLEHFTDYQYIHLDIAGPAFLTSSDSYRGNGGTGVGVRLLFDFIQNYGNL